VGPVAETAADGVGGEEGFRSQPASAPTIATAAITPDVTRATSLEEKCDAVVVSKDGGMAGLQGRA
jgi:hypothetical protein